ncbi:MAG TPA: hypothetical protein VN794_16705 [Methylomirabilota bacterium]|nr:hypothetical protein [Methylomirabilota bacterium]
MVIRNQLHTGIELLVGRVGPQSHIAHAEQRIARTKIKKEIHQRTFARLQVESLRELQEKLVGSLGLPARGKDVDLRARRFGLDRPRNWTDCSSGGTDNPSPSSLRTWLETVVIWLTSPWYFFNLSRAAAIRNLTLAQSEKWGRTNQTLNTTKTMAATPTTTRFSNGRKLFQ